MPNLVTLAASKINAEKSSIVVGYDLTWVMTRGGGKSWERVHCPTVRVAAAGAHHRDRVRLGTEPDFNSQGLFRFFVPNP